MRVRNWICLLLTLCLLCGAAVTAHMEEEAPILEQAESAVPEASVELAQDLEALSESTEAVLDLLNAGLNGWQEIGGNWYYYENDMPLTGWQYVDGKWYYLDDDGVMQTGWLEEGSATYYLAGSGAMAEGWKYIDDCWYYFIPGSGKMAENRWKEINGKWYYFDAGGSMRTGWLYDGGKWYWFPASGAMAEGWKYIDDEWYYFLPGSGARAENRWKEINGKWYYFYEGGVMATGWEELNGKGYYFLSSGAMAEGWKHIVEEDYLDAWYYFLPGDGRQAVGWKQIEGKWYYFDPGEWIGDHSMATGWRSINGKIYYFNKSGAMVTGTQVIQGEVFTFGSSGALNVNPVPAPSGSIIDLSYLLDLDTTSLVQQIGALGFEMHSEKNDEGEATYWAGNSDIEEYPYILWETYDGHPYRWCTIDHTNSPSYSLSGITSNLSVSQAKNALNSKGWKFDVREVYDDPEDDFHLISYYYKKEYGGRFYYFGIFTTDETTIYYISQSSYVQ